MSPILSIASTSCFTSGLQNPIWPLSYRFPGPGTDVVFNNGRAARLLKEHLRVLIDKLPELFLLGGSRSSLLATTTGNVGILGPDHNTAKAVLSCHFFNRFKW